MTDRWYYPYSKSFYEQIERELLQSGDDLLPHLRSIPFHIEYNKEKEVSNMVKMKRYLKKQKQRQRYR